MGEQGAADSDQHETVLLGIVTILRRMELKQSQLDKKAAAQWLATIGLGLIAVGIGCIGLIGALPVTGEPDRAVLEVCSLVLFLGGVVVWFVAAFRLYPVWSLRRRKAIHTDKAVDGRGL